MAAKPDRLSDLPDELLHHILRLAPAREAASTAVLSRRWRGLWPPPGSAAVVLDTRAYAEAPENDRDDALWGPRTDRDAFFRGAEAALAAHVAGVRSLAVHVESRCQDSVECLMSYDRGPYCRYREARYIVDDVIGHPACLAVEELSLTASSGWSSRSYSSDSDSWVPNNPVGRYKLSLGCMPSQALRVLHITDFRDRTPAGSAAAFPCLEVLRLKHCTVSLHTLRAMVAASPQLATLHLQGVYLTTKYFPPLSPDDDDHDDNIGYRSNYKSNKSDDEDARDNSGPVESFCCGGVTSLVLVNTSCRNNLTIELDMPRVQSLRFRGSIVRFSLSPPPDLQQADLQILESGHYAEGRCKRFWLFFSNFGNSKLLKLKLDFPMDDIVVANEKELLGDTLFFHNLERLEVDAQYRPGSDDVGVAIGNLLQCCPMVRDLRLKVNTVDRLYGRRGRIERRSAELYTTTFLKRKSERDTFKSIDHFARRRNLEVCLVEGGGGEGGNGDQCGASDVPGLSDKWFNFGCLRGSLRRVSLQFRKDKRASSFGSQLVKFFLERAMFLEEMYIDDGNRKMCEHMNCKVGGGASNNASQPCSEYKVSKGTSQMFGASRLNSTKVRGGLTYSKLRTNPWSTNFRVLPLER